MNKLQRTAACILAAAMVCGLTACDESEPAVSGSQSGISAPGSESAATQASTTTDPDANAATDKEVKEIDISVYTPDGNAGTVKILSFYDVTTDQKGTEQSLIFQSDVYGGSIDWISTPSGDAYFEKLSTLISSDDSPDIVTKDAFLYPGTAAKNMFEALDSYIDKDNTLWSDMSGIIDSFVWNGKHFYYPHRITTSFALNYSKKTIEENDLPDPYELYKKGEWTWDAWHDMMVKFCDKDENNIGFYGPGTITGSFIATTGTTLVNVNSDGTIQNNIKTPEVTRAMTFLEKLNRDGLTYKNQFDSWVSPQVFSEHCDQLLFLGMEPEWTYTAATENIQNKKGVDDDIFGTVSDFAFVPFPRDSAADTYYQAYDTYGFLVPKGSRNIKGAVDFINCFRVYDTDPEIQAQVRKDHVDPTPVYFQDGKYAGSEKWQITWGEQEYDLWREMCDPSKFTSVMENAWGFSSDFESQYIDVLNSVTLDGESWTKRSEEFSPIVDSVIADYNK